MLKCKYNNMEVIFISGIKNQSSLGGLKANVLAFLTSLCSWDWDLSFL